MNAADFRAAQLYRRSSLHGALVLLGALVVVCSALSPADDDIQQVFFHRTPQCSRVAPENSCSSMHLPRNRTTQAAVLLAFHSAPRYKLAATLSVGESQVSAELFASTNGERSPPIC